MYNYGRRRQKQTNDWSSQVAPHGLHRNPRWAVAHSENIKKILNEPYHYNLKVYWQG